MKFQISRSIGTALCGLLLTAGCDVHRTDPVPEIAPAVGTPSLEANERARPTTRDGRDERDARMPQSRIDEAPENSPIGQVASASAWPSSRPVQGVRLVDNALATAPGA